MARQPSNKSGGRFRLVVLEAELGDGNDISQMAQAIQNALKPTQVANQRIVYSPAKALPSPNGTVEDIEEISEADDSLDVEQEVKPQKPREARVRRVSSPEIVEDLDMHSDPSWKSFAQAKKPESNIEKFLVAAEWCKVARGLHEISANHVFTCFKVIGWSTSISDFSQPLRHLKSVKLMGAGSEKGLYKINHVGSDRVKDMEES